MGDPAPRLSAILGHGASGTAASMRPWVEGLRAHGIEARAIDLPRGTPERAIGVFAEALEREPGAVLGGHSFGGRMASLAAARLLENGRDMRALLLLSYPLHRPGDPDGWVARTEHWPALRCPVLLLSGEADPFARIGLLREAVRLLPDARLVTYPRVGHGLALVFEAALGEAVAFLRGLDGPRG